jgi:hypothetical protein
MQLRNLLLNLALLTPILVAGTLPATLPAGAQVVNPAFAGGYDRWQPAWDNYQYDRRHVILGTVASFEPFRLQVARHDGVVQTIDLKNGTIILPTGETPGSNERVAVTGYYSHGTFIANRVILHD